MLHSIHTRLVVVFIAIVIASTFITFTIMGSLYQDERWQMLQDDLREIAEQVVKLYSVRQEITLEEIEGFLQTLAKKSNARISIYQQAGLIASYQGADVKRYEKLNPQIVQTVLQGSEYAGKNDQDQPPTPLNTVIGLPFSYGQDGQATCAVIIQPVEGQDMLDFNRTLKLTLLIVLVTGSLLILIVTRYLVTPIVKLTEATKQLARGDYRIELENKRKDELGNLTENFKMMAAQLEQIEKMRRDFVANVSHELQSPLTSIRGFSKVLLEDAGTDPKKHRFSQIIYNESNRLSRLCANLLQLASLESEHHPFQRTTYQLDEQIRQVVVALEPQWSQKDLDIYVELPSVEIEADRDQLSQVWMNLLTNGIKFSNPQGSIWIRMMIAGGKVTVSIADQGIGIASEDLPYIFDRFYKSDKSRERAKCGSGLGLSIVSKIVQLHNGQIAVQSEPRKGTTIKVTLPLSYAKKSMKPTWEA